MIGKRASGIKGFAANGQIRGMNGRKCGSRFLHSSWWWRWWLHAVTAVEAFTDQPDVIIIAGPLAFLGYRPEKDAAKHLDVFEYGCESIDMDFTAQ